MHYYGLVWRNISYGNFGFKITIARRMAIVNYTQIRRVKLPKRFPVDRWQTRACFLPRQRRQSTRFITASDRVEFEKLALNFFQSSYARVSILNRLTIYTYIIEKRIDLVSVLSCGVFLKWARTLVHACGDLLGQSNDDIFGIFFLSLNPGSYRFISNTLSQIHVMAFLTLGIASPPE